MEGSYRQCVMEKECRFGVTALHTVANGLWIFLEAKGPLKLQNKQLYTQEAGRKEGGKAMESMLTLRTELAIEETDAMTSSMALEYKSSKIKMFTKETLSMEKLTRKERRSSVMEISTMETELTATTMDKGGSSTIKTVQATQVCSSWVFSMALES